MSASPPLKLTAKRRAARLKDFFGSLKKRNAASRPLEALPTPPVSYRRQTALKLRTQTAVSNIWFLTLTIPASFLLVIDWHVAHSDADTSGFLSAIAGVCSAIGSIVAIFLPLTLHQFTTAEPAFNEKPEDQFRRQWVTRLQRVTKYNVVMAIFVLLANTALVLLSFGEFKLFDGMAIQRWICYVTFFLLVFGLTCFFLQLFTLGITDRGDLDRVGLENHLRGIPWYSYIRSILIILSVESLLSISLGVIFFIFLTEGRNKPFQGIRAELILKICLMIWIPLLLATLYTLLTSRRYRDMWRDRFLKKWGEHAALGLVCNFDLTKEALRSGIDKHTTRVLLNRQDQEPFRGMWLVPGGYMNPKKGDRQLPDTVCRRLKKLTHIGGRFVAENTDLLAYPFKNTRRQAPAWLKKVDEDLSPPEGEKPGRLKHITSRLIKKSERDLVDFSRDYTEAVLRYSHAPTDTCLYLVRGTRSLSTLEQEIQTTEDSDLKWWSIQEIECTSKIPSHLKDLLLYVLTKKHTDLWELEEGLRHAR